MRVDYGKKNKKLQDMCRRIATEIHEGKGSASEFMDGVYNIRWILNQDKSYRAAELMVAGGGPTIWVDLSDDVVKGYWWGDQETWSFQDNLGLNEYCEEMYGC